MDQRLSNFKKEVGEIFKNLFSKLTPGQGKSISLIFSAVIALIFLVTSTGRMVITVLGYLLFAYCIIWLAYKFYIFASTYSTAIPKPKVVVSDETYNEVTLDDDDEPVAEAEESDDISAEDNGAVEEEEKQEEFEHQITIDELETQSEDNL